MKIKIYGYGWVGKAMKDLFPDAVIHDPQQGYVNEDKADVAFVCVPTPNKPDGSLDTSIVEGVVRNAPEDFIIIRSTVMPGTTEKLSIETSKNIVFQPEYLGETKNHPMTDQHARPFIILGGSSVATRKAIEVYQKAYNANIKIRQLDSYTAEVIKLTENRAIAYKVAQCQELYDACQKANIDYYEVVQAVYGDDPRFNLWFTFVYPEARGFNSKCIPKDVYGWAAWAESVGYKPELTQKLLEVNDKYINA
jgi:UDPglucose 6-dehydrogenase